MPIIDITPTSSRIHERPVKITPIYLITEVLSSGTRWLAVKLDESNNVIKFVGVELKKSEKRVEENYQEILNSADKTLYKEVWLPWHQINSIQNLIFKQK